MADSEYSTGGYKPFIISINKTTKNPEKLKFGLDYLNPNPELPFVIRYVPHQCKTTKCVIKLYWKMVER